MVKPGVFRSSERCAEAIDRLAAWATRLNYDDLPDSLRERLTLMLVDLFGVTAAGARTPEFTALLEDWYLPSGDFPLIGTGIRTSPETGAYLSAIAACTLELDEGNKFAAGHPAAHVVFAAVATVAMSPREITGRQFLTAVAAGYEVAARFGSAVRRNPQWHTHGHWGATGAAAASALILGAGESELAGAIDASTGLMHVTPWATVLSGSFTRNLWLAGANMAGVNATRLALSGLVQNTGQAQHSLGEIVGTLDPTRLDADLGSTWLAGRGYLKRHASCSYTHAAVDIVQTLRMSHPWAPDEVKRVRVVTNSLGGALNERHPQNRLAAMFSLPFVVSNAVVNGRVDPRTMDPETPEFVAAENFSEHVAVEVEPDFDSYLPDRRCTEVTIELGDGMTLGLCQPNPIGDAQHFPLSETDVRSKLTSLIGAEATGQLEKAIGSLADAKSLARVLDPDTGIAGPRAAPSRQRRSREGTDLHTL